MHRMIWVIKVSKLCNLRCRYCYEWDELGNPARISLPDWAKLLHAIKHHNEQQARRLGVPVETRMVWHGGEPLLLPSEYIREVLALQEEIFGHPAIGAGIYSNNLQTNLYKLTDEKLDLLKETGFRVGVSLDLAGGTRLTAGGQKTEARVAANMDRLADAGLPFGAITVLAGHTVKHLRAIYDFMETMNIGFRILPLFPSPLGGPDAPFAISREEMVAALNDLFLYWMERDFSVNITPLDRYLKTAMMQIGDLKIAAWQRRLHGDGVLVVNTDGNLYQVIDAYDEKLALGNLFHQPIEQILASKAHADSLDRAEAVEAEHCGPCAFRDVCGHGHVFESRIANPPGGRCAVAHDVQGFIVSHLRHIGFDASALRDLEALEEAAAV